MNFGVPSGFGQVNIKFFSINKNYLETVDNKKYFIANEIQDNRNKLEAVKMLYEKPKDKE